MGERADWLDKPRHERKNVVELGNEPSKEDGMRKMKYVKPGVVGGSSVHPC